MPPIDITVGGDAKEQPEPEDKPGSKRYLGVKFICGSAYLRIYRNDEGTAYVGRCPSCLKEVIIKIGEGGTDGRFFKYDCGKR